MGFTSRENAAPSWQLQDALSPLSNGDLARPAVAAARYIGLANVYICSGAISLEFPDQRGLTKGPAHDQKI